MSGPTLWQRLFGGPALVAISYVNAYGEEGGLSAQVAVNVPENGGIRLKMPSPPPDAVTARIYRTGKSGKLRGCFGFLLRWSLCCLCFAFCQSFEVKGGKIVPTLGCCLSRACCCRIGYSLRQMRRAWRSRWRTNSCTTSEKTILCVCCYCCSARCIGFIPSRGDSST